jgi:hypothetical protein
MILPIVMYHGVTPWSEPRLFDALLDVPASVRPAVALYLVEFAYLLNDLSEISDEDRTARARSHLHVSSRRRDHAGSGAKPNRAAGDPRPPRCSRPDAQGSLRGGCDRQNVGLRGAEAAGDPSPTQVEGPWWERQYFR